MLAVKKLRIRQTWAVKKQYKKSHQGNGWKKPFASRDFIVHENICIQAIQPISATPDSGSGPSNDVSSMSSIEKVKERVDLLRKKLALMSKPKQDVTSDHVDCTYFFCWVLESSFLAPHYSQITGECWSVAMSRGHAYHIAINKLNDKKTLTREELLKGVSPHLLNDSGGLPKFEYLREFMVNEGYCKDMIFHRRHSDDFEGFERLMDELLARGTVVASFERFPSYYNYDGKSIYIPDDIEWQAAVYENFSLHAVVVTGCGFKVYRGEVIEFWRTQDSQDPSWGVEGFGALARHKGLITSAVEFKF